MTESLACPPTGVAARDRSHTLFAQTMGYVALVAALFALGTYLSRALHGGVASPSSPPSPA
jgi:modulator of FtsH protease